MSNVFVIIVSYNGKQWYDRCFTSLQESEIPVQTVVVDNASTDDTVSYIKEHFPQVYLIESKVNLGFGQGNNKGMRYALDNGADYVFLLNQDAWIEPDTIGTLIAAHKKQPEYGILSPMHLNAEKTAIEKGLIHYVADLKITDPAWINDLYFGTTKDIYSTSYVNAAAWLLPRKTIEVVGGFDPIFFHYGEDDNYMHRVLYHGLKIGICPTVRVVHDTERRIKKSTETMQAESKNLLVELTNVNYSGSVALVILNSIQKFIFHLLKFNFSTTKYHVKKIRYIIQMKNNIINSKNANKTEGPHWL